MQYNDGAHSIWSEITRWGDYLVVIFWKWSNTSITFLLEKLLQRFYFNVITSLSVLHHSVIAHSITTNISQDLAWTAIDQDYPDFYINFCSRWSTVPIRQISHFLQPQDINAQNEQTNFIHSNDLLLNFRLYQLCQRSLKMHLMAMKIAQNLVDATLYCPRDLQCMIYCDA